MAIGTLIEQRRRVSDRDRRQLNFLMTLSWIVITSSVVFVILLADFLRFKSASLEKITAVEYQLLTHIRRNEAVLEGFAAFLSGQQQLDDARTSDYATKIRQRFPHVFLLEVAEGVNVDDLPALVSRQRQKGYPEFQVRAFDYKDQRDWRPLPQRQRYYPLIFLSPMSQESRGVLGLELGSHDFLDRPMQQALITGDYQTSVPFRLIEGYKGYVMFKPVDGAEDIGNREISRFIVLIVLLADPLAAEIAPLLDDATSVIVYHNDKEQSDIDGHLYRQPASAGIPSLSTGRRLELEDGRHGYVLSIRRHVRLSDVSWALIGLAIVCGLLIYIYSRNFVLKRYMRDLEWAKDEARLQFLASYDSLTKLPNRRFLVNLIETRLEEFGEKLKLAMLFLDLDLFKQVNDEHGHKMGDVLLQEVALRIKKRLRKDDMAGRLGGDEFIVLLANYASRESVQQVVGKLREEIEMPFHIEGRALNITVSIGVAYYPEDTDDILDLLHLADKAMYRNKANRKKLKLVGQTE